MAKETATDKAAEKVAAARKKNLDLAITHIQKEFGEAAIMRMGDENCIVRLCCCFGYEAGACR